MGLLSKTEVNLRRLLATAPQQQNQAKLIHVCPQLFHVECLVLSFDINNENY